MGVLYDFNQQIVPIDKDYDVVKEVPIGYVLYKLAEPFFAFYPKQFVGVRNGIKVNDQNSQWALIDTQSYFEQYGNDTRVVENMPEEYKEELRKKVLEFLRNKRKIKPISEAEKLLEHKKQIEEQMNKDNLDDEPEILKITFGETEPDKPPDINMVKLAEESGLKFILNDSSYVEDRLNAAKDETDLLFIITSVALYSLQEMAENVEEIKEILESYTILDCLDVNIFELLENKLKELKDNPDYFFTQYHYKYLSNLRFLKKIALVPYVKRTMEILGTYNEGILAANLGHFLHALFYSVDRVPKSNLSLFLMENNNNETLFNRYLEIVHKEQLDASDLGDLTDYYKLFELYVTGTLSSFLNIPGSYNDKLDFNQLKIVLGDILRYYASTEFSDYREKNLYPEYAIPYISSVFDLLLQDEELQILANNKTILNAQKVLAEQINLLEEIKSKEKLGVGANAAYAQLKNVIKFMFVTLNGDTDSKKALLASLHNTINFIKDDMKKDTSEAEYIYKRRLPATYSNLYFKTLLNEVNIKYLAKLLEKETKEELNFEELLKSKKTREEALALFDTFSLQEKETFLERRFYEIENLAVTFDEFSAERVVKIKELADARCSGEVKFMGENFDFGVIGLAALTDFRLADELEFSEELEKLLGKTLSLDRLRRKSKSTLSQEEKFLYLQCFRLLKKDFSEVTKQEIDELLNSINKNITDEDSLNRFIGIVINAFRSRFSVETLSDSNKLLLDLQQGFYNIYDYLIDRLDLSMVYPYETDAFIFNTKQRLRNISFTGKLGFTFINNGFSDTITMTSELLESTKRLLGKLKTKDTALYEEAIEFFGKKINFDTELEAIESLRRIAKFTFKVLDAEKQRLSDPEYSYDSSFFDDLLRMSGHALSLDFLLSDVRDTGIAFSGHAISRIERESSGFYVNLLHKAINYQQYIDTVNELYERMSSNSAIPLKEFVDSVLRTRPFISDYYGFITAEIDSIHRRLHEFTKPTLLSFSFLNSKINTDFLEGKKIKDLIGIRLLFYHYSSRPFREHATFQNLDTLLYARPYNMVVDYLHNRFITNPGYRNITNFNQIDILDTEFNKDELFDNVQDIELEIKPTEVSSQDNSFVFKLNLENNDSILFALPVRTESFALFTSYLISQLYANSAINPDDYKKLVRTASLYMDAISEDYSGISSARKGKYGILMSSEAYLKQLKEVYQLMLSSPSAKKVFLASVRTFASALDNLEYLFDGKYHLTYKNGLGYRSTAPQKFLEFISDYFEPEKEDFFYTASKKLSELFKKLPPEYLKVFRLVPINFLKDRSNQKLGFTFAKRYEINDYIGSNYSTSLGVSDLSPIFVVDRPYQGLYEKIISYRPKYIDFFDREIDPAAAPFIGEYSDDKVMFSVVSKEGYSTKEPPTFLSVLTHEFGHVISYKLDLQTKKRMFKFYHEKYVKEAKRVFDGFISSLDAVAKISIESLYEAIARDVDKILQEQNEDVVEELIDVVRGKTNQLERTIFSIVRKKGQSYYRVIEEARKFMTPYSLSSYQELHSTALDLYFSDREEFVKDYPDEYREILLPMLKYIHQRTGLDLTIDNSLGGEPIFISYKPTTKELYEVNKRTPT